MPVANSLIVFSKHSGIQSNTEKYEKGDTLNVKTQMNGKINILFDVNINQPNLISYFLSLDVIAENIWTW